VSESESCDAIVIGAGAAGMTAAAVAAAEGLQVLLVEKTSLVGGTAAWSGGMVWVPANHKMREIGLADNVAAARLYLRNTVPDPFNLELRETFLARADEAISYLEAHTQLRFMPVKTYPDYYPALPGATEGGRVLEPCPFDARALGADFAILRPPLPEFTLFGGMMISRQDIPHFRKLGRSARSTWRAAQLLGRHARQRLSHPRGTTLYLGNALAGRLLLSLRGCNVELVRETTAESLLRSEGCIEGAVLRSKDGTRREVRARRAVILASGGFSHDRALRARYLPTAAGALTAAAPGNAGDGIRLGLAAGGWIGTANASAAFWVPASRFRRGDGGEGVFPHTVTDRAKPGLIAIDRSGKRFVNEALSYHEFVLAMLRDGNSATEPAYLICDRGFLWKYGLGRIRPFALALKRDIASNYLHTAPTPRALAASLGIDAERFVATLETYNRGAREGRDEEFGRGGDAYQRHLGDAENRPNPCVAPIERAPFYAVAVYPADLGTAAGLVTDTRARVLEASGNPIPRLYACGNDMNSIMNGNYPGPGITLGPALTFAYLAARDAAARWGPG